MAISDSLVAIAPHEWTLKRNCSLSPGQFGALLGSLAIVTVAVAVFFAWSGAWWILFFAVIQVAALVATFVVYARHAGDYERIVLTSEALIVECNSANHFVREQTHPALARVQYPCPGLRQGGDSLIGLAVAGKAVRVGRFVPHPRRASLAREIRMHLLAAGKANWR